MIKYLVLAAAFLMLPVTASAHGILNSDNLTGHASVPQKCEQRIDLNARRLSTNYWGASAQENIPQYDNCVFSNNRTFGWMWNRTQPASGGPIYFSVATGTDPWGGYSNSRYLPVKIMNLSSFMLEVRYQYLTLPSQSDSVNFAYDIWITDTDKPGQGTQRNEVMIWLNRLNVPMPEDKRKEDVSDGYNTYTQYAWENYHAFILNDAPASGRKYQKVNPKKLIDYLAAKGDLNPNLWVSQIDLGSEVWKSRGKLEILYLNIRLNNKLI